MPPATPDLVKLARDWVTAGFERDTAFIAANSYAEDGSAIHTVASLPDAHLPLDAFIEHLSEAPPRKVLSSNPVGFVNGDMAWLFDTPTADMLYDGIVEFRHTIVFLRVNGAWKVVHDHLSEGRPREIV